MEKTYADFSERRAKAVLSKDRPRYDGASIDLLMYRWRLGKVDAALEILNSIELMNMLGDPADYILENVMFKLQVMADHNLRLMEGDKDGQRESDHN